MIQVRVWRDEERRVSRVFVQGHTNSAPYGEDLVCAAVSGISIGLVNAIESLFGIQVHAEDDGDGKVDCCLPEGLDSAKMDQIRLIMQAMVIALEGIAEQYPAYVRMEYIEVR